MRLRFGRAPGLIGFLVCPALMAGQHPQGAPAAAEIATFSRPKPGNAEAAASSGYVLGPDDQIAVTAMDAPDISNKPVYIDTSGYITLALVGHIRAAGLTTQQLEAVVASRLKQYILDPQVAVSVTEFRSQPVSVIGAVNSPGVHQLRGNKRLIEVLSLAGGIRNDAGHTVKITRNLQWGPIPLPTAKNDSTGQFSVAEVSLKAITSAASPEENVLIKPNDVISVPRGELVYVIGEVEKAGGFVLAERESVSVLQALSLAGGLSRQAAPQNARILRQAETGSERTEVAVDLKKILAGKAKDVPLTSDDILFIPGSASRKAAARVAETALQTLTGVVIFRGGR